jgi:hypothetical protein
MITHTSPDYVDTVVYDMMAIVQSLPTNMPTTYSGIAKMLLDMICSTPVPGIQLVFDT